MDFEKSENRKKQKKEEMMQKINIFFARYFNWLLTFIVLVVLVGGGFFILKPKYDYINELKNGNEYGQEQEYSARREYLNKIKNLIEVYNNVSSSDVKKVNFILAERDVPEELFPQIESLTKGNGLLLESLKIEPAEENVKSTGVSLTKEVKSTVSLPPEIERMKASLSVAGVDYFSLKSLISAFENNLMVMDITSLSFKPDTGSADLVFYAYSLKKAN